MSKKIRYIIITTLLVVGVALLFTTTDKKYIHLTSTEGSPHTLQLETGKTYTQSFINERLTISRIGFDFVTLKRNLPNDAISLTILQNNKEIHKAEIPIIFITNDGASDIHLRPALAVEQGQKVDIQITVPKSLSKNIGIQLREPDDTFDTNKVQLYIDDEQQEAPAAYLVYHLERPPLPLQVGLLLILGAIYMASGKSWGKQPKITQPLCALFFALLFSLPAMLNGSFPALLIIIQTAILLITYRYLRKSINNPLPAMFGASIFAFTSWFIMHSISPILTPETLNLKDIFLDPNQAIPSHAAGSYVGIIAILFAILGIASSWKKNKVVLALGISAAILTILPYAITTHLIILTTFSIAVLAANGMHKLMIYLGETDKLVITITITLMILSMLDMFNIAANTLIQIIT